MNSFLCQILTKIIQYDSKIAERVCLPDYVVCIFLWLHIEECIWGNENICVYLFIFFFFFLVRAYYFRFFLFLFLLIVVFIEFFSFSMFLSVNHNEGTSVWNIHWHLCSYENLILLFRLASQFQENASHFLEPCELFLFFESIKINFGNRIIF